MSVPPISDVAIVIVRDGPSGRSELYLPPSAAALEIPHRERPDARFKQETGETLASLKKGLRDAHGSEILATYPGPRIRNAEFGGVILAGDVRRAGAGGPGIGSFVHVTVRNPYVNPVVGVPVLSQVIVGGERAEQTAKMDESLSKMEVLDRHAEALLSYFYGISHGGRANPIRRCKGGEVKEGEKVNAPVLLPYMVPPERAWREVAARYCRGESLVNLDIRLLSEMAGNSGGVTETGIWAPDASSVFAHPYLVKLLRDGSCAERAEVKCIKGGEMEGPAAAGAFKSFDGRVSKGKVAGIGRREGIAYLGETDGGPRGGKPTRTAGYVYSVGKDESYALVFDAQHKVPYFVKIEATGKSVGLVAPEQGILKDAVEKLKGAGPFSAYDLRTGRPAEFSLHTPDKSVGFWDAATCDQRDEIRAAYRELGIELRK